MQLGALHRDVLGFFEALATEYGDVAQFRFGTFRATLLNHPDHVQQVLVSKHAGFVKGRPLRLARQLLGEGMLTSEGDHHNHQSRMISPLLSSDRLKGFAPSIIGEARRHAEQWQDGEERDMLAEMVRLATVIAARTMFTWDLAAPAAANISTSVDQAMRLFPLVTVPFAEQLLKIPLPSHRKFYQAKAHLDATIFELIDSRRRSADRPDDLLSRLIEVHDQQRQSDCDERIRDEALTLFLTAFDTASLCLTWTWFLLARNPEVEAALHDELETVLGGRQATATDLPSLRYARMLVFEALRLFPPIYVIAREVIEDFEVAGYRLPAGTLVMVSPWLLQRDPRFFSEPDCCDPLRWDTRQGRNTPHFAYFPFGAGPRGCIGRAYGLQEVVLVIATIAQHWRMRSLGEGLPPMRPLLNLRPKDGLPMRLERRR